MTGPENPDSEGPASPQGSWQDLARDWITIWQSELAAGAQDREAQETWQKLLALWASTAGSLVRAVPAPPWAVPPWAASADGGRAGPAAAARSAAAAAAPDPGDAEDRAKGGGADGRDAEIRRLAGHVAELERRLAGLERGGKDGG